MSLNFIDPAGLDPDQRENGTVFAPRFDAQGLIPVVTVAAEGHEVLMFAHMNAEALALTLTTGIAHYWSRSRQSLWKKGETSGETQHVVEMRTDCDQDCIVMSVRQAGRGAACHTGRQSCFYRRVDIKTGTARLVDAGVPQIFDPASVYKS